MKMRFQRRASAQLVRGEVITPKGRLTIGRGTDNDVVIYNRLVSARHAVIERTGNGLWIIEDQGSKHGTWVNKEKAKRRIILPGDEIVFSSGAETLIAENYGGRVAVFFNDGSPEHRTKINEIVEKLEKRGFIVLNITQKTTLEGIIRELQNGTDPMNIGNWVEPFASDLNIDMGYMLLYYCAPRAEADDHTKHIFDAFSRISAATKTLLIEGYDRENLASRIQRGTVAFRTMGQRVDECLLGHLSGRRKYEERLFGGKVNIEFPNGAIVTIPPRTERKLRIF